MGRPGWGNVDDQTLGGISVIAITVGGVEVNRWFGSIPEQEFRQAFTDALA